jgi:dipeptidyl aminopeptidase/acylaminoacyl peptidase
MNLFESTLHVLDRLRDLSDLCWTPDGSAILATVTPVSHAQGEGFASRLWQFGLDGSASLVTDAAGKGSDSAPQFSPDGKAFAFLSDRDRLGRQSLFIREDGAERAIGTIAGSVEQFAWIEAGRALLALAADHGLDAGATSGAMRLDWDGGADPELTSVAPRRRLFRIGIEDGATSEVGPADLSLWEFDVVDDRTVVAIASSDPSERGWYHTRIVRLMLDRSAAPAILHRSDWQLQGPAVDPARRRVAFLEGWSSDRGLVAGDVRLLDLTTGQVTTISPSGLSNISALQWRDETSLWFAGWADMGSIYGVMRLDGSLAWMEREEAVLGPSSFLAKISPAPDGTRFATVCDRVGQPPEIVVKDAPGADWRVLTQVNAGVSRDVEAYPEVRILRWQGAGGLEMQGFLLLPRERPEGPLPMVVDVHGGPTWSVKHAFNPGFGLPYAAAGFAVFLPNYRGNVGWGQPFARLNIGDPGGEEFQDILLGVEACIAEGIADPDRIGITGASYGGYLTAWAVATSERFKAAVMVSGIANQWSCHYSCNHAFTEWIVGGPLTDPDRRALALDRSPMMRLERPVTPTLIIHGREDRCTPVGQAHEFHAGLREHGVETELAIYPREGHGFAERDHRFDAWRRQVAWFDRHLRPAP